jgi:hypothetical protein
LGCWWHKWVDQGLNKSRACFYIYFFRCPSEFTEPLTYFFR